MEPIFEKILTELQALREGQARMDTTQLQQGQDLKALRKDVAQKKPRALSQNTGLVLGSSECITFMAHKKTCGASRVFFIYF